MKNERTVTLNDKGILLVVTIILALVFALGFSSASKRKDPEPTIFSREDLERIVELQTMEDERESGAEIYAYKDKDGNLIIGWEYNKKRK